MWLIFVEFRSASSEGTWRKKERRKYPGKIKSVDMYGTYKNGQNDSSCSVLIARIITVKLCSTVCIGLTTAAVSTRVSVRALYRSTNVARSCLRQRTDSTWCAAETQSLSHRDPDTTFASPTSSVVYVNACSVHSMRQFHERRFTHCTCSSVCPSRTACDTIMKVRMKFKFGTRVPYSNCY